MKLQCAWCKKNFDEHEIVDDRPISDGISSHGICLNCLIELNLFKHYEFNSLSTDLVNACIQGEFVLDDENNVKSYSTEDVDLINIIHESIVGRNILTEISPFAQIEVFKEKLSELRKGNKTRQEKISFLLSYNDTIAFVAIDIAYFMNSKYVVLITRKIGETIN